MTPDDQITPTDGGGDVVITDRELFDQAIAPTPPPQSTEQAPPQVPDQSRGQAPAPIPEVAAARQRDAQGRFIPGQAPQQPSQQGVQGQQPPQQPQRAAQQPPQHHVPLRELLDERERRQKLEAEANQLRIQWQQLEQAAAMQRQQGQPQQPQTIFDAPDQYLANNVINPLRQEGHMAMMQIKDGLSREMANQQFGEKLVSDALAELTKVRYTPDGNHTFNQIMASGHPYGALVKWHSQARAHQAIGADPNAWLRQKQQEWVRDPNAQRAVLEYIRQQQGQQRQAQPPNVQLPPSLSSLPGAPAGAESFGDLSDASLYAFATAPPRR